MLQRSQPTKSRRYRLEPAAGHRLRFRDSAADERHERSRGEVQMSDALRDGPSRRVGPAGPHVVRDGRRQGMQACPRAFEFVDYGLQLIAQFG